MGVEIERNPVKPCRIISGAPAVVEAEINLLWETYTMVSYTVSSNESGVTVTAIAILTRKLREQQLDAARGNVPIFKR